MNKKISKMLTVASAVAMPIMGTHGVAFAVGVPSTPKGTITVKNVDKDDTATVTAFKIVEPEFSSHGITGFKEAHANLKIADITKPTSEEIQKIATQIISDKTNVMGLKTINLSAAADGTTYSSGEATAGMYIVIVTDSNASIYNPAVVSLNLSDTNGEGTLSEEEAMVDMNTRFSYGSTAYLKKSLPTLEKKIVGSSENNDNGDTVAAGDEINFEVQTLVPSYKLSSEVTGGNGTIYEAPTFKITDKLDTTFAEITDIVVQVKDEGEENTFTPVTGAEFYTVNKDADGKGFNIPFTAKFISDYSGRTVRVLYKTSLTKEGASKNLVANKNTATLEYTNDPKVETDIKKIEKHTYHYSFNLDLKKINEENKPLAGAEFTLFSDESTSTVVQKVVSTTEGLIPFEGLDEGTYYVKETKAPAGYSINDNVYKVDIAADLNPAGILTNYTVTISGADLETPVTSTFTDTNPTTGVAGEVTSKPTGKYSYVEVKNTTIAKMPSTGGAGTLVLSGVGVTLFLGAAGAFNKARKMKKEEE